MLCPRCGQDDDKVKATSRVLKATTVRRRRVCNNCHWRWWTVEQATETVKEVADAMKQGLDFLMGKDGDDDGH